MAESSAGVEFELLDKSRIDMIEPLWEQLREHHGRMDWAFAHEMADVTFAGRKAGILARATDGVLRLEIVREAGDLIGYCVSSVSAGKEGELDSMFVAPDRRGRGIGEQLARRSLEWMEACGTEPKRVVVADGNQAARALYRKLGFVERTTTMQLVADDSKSGS